ncbi:phage integrase N-terminal domain-containing protein [Pantoea dispersa]|uniref:phage integrase N-terminal domain-containing protein n=1 Tax=Pantoea dispersa TaxID=59814 RepID=UPI0023ED4E19|nr:phage integrase N-terminal domain-containing protein [Pantoea dispersa]
MSSESCRDLAILSRLADDISKRTMQEEMAALRAILATAPELNWPIRSMKS